MRCPKCGTESLPAKRFCAECGSPLPIKCSKCGADTPANAKFCADCGAPLNSIARPSSASPAVVQSTAKEIRITPRQGEAVCTTEGERKLVTALFADIKGSTELNLQAEFYRLKGELTLLKDPQSEREAESYLRQAIDIARRQAARLFELRATTSLARLLAKQGRRDEARAVMAEIYRWFTEGFDTADLKEAASLLEELST